MLTPDCETDVDFLSDEAISKTVVFFAIKMKTHFL